MIVSTRVGWGKSGPVWRCRWPVSAGLMHQSSAGYRRLSGVYVRVLSRLVGFTVKRSFPRCPKCGHRPGQRRERHLYRADLSAAVDPPTTTWMGFTDNPVTWR